MKTSSAPEEQRQLSNELRDKTTQCRPSEVSATHLFSYDATQFLSSFGVGVDWTFNESSKSRDSRSLWRLKCGAGAWACRRSNACVEGRARLTSPRSRGSGRGRGGSLTCHELLTGCSC